VGAFEFRISGKVWQLRSQGSKKSGKQGVRKKFGWKMFVRKGYDRNR
jgi:hypothetical protein